MLAGVTNTLLGGDKGAREKQEYFLFRRKTKKETKIMVMSPIKFHTCVIFNYEKTNERRTKQHLKLQSRAFFPCINFFFKLLHNVTNKNIYFYKGSSGHNIILPEGNQMFSIFKVMSLLIKAVANPSLRSSSSC